MPAMFEARFQTFDDAADGAQGSRRVAALRAELKRRGLDGFLVPRADRQQNEYLPASEERLAWLTGFTGSAGAAGRSLGAMVRSGAGSSSARAASAALRRSWRSAALASPSAVSSQ